MKVGDLIGIGWNGRLKQPYVAVITQLSKVSDGYMVLVLATGNKQYILRSDIQELSNSEVINAG